MQRRVDAERVEAAAGRGPGSPAATASGSPGTGSSAAAGWGSRRSGRRSAGARAGRRRRSRARARARASVVAGGRCRRRPRCRRAAGSRSPAPPSSAAGAGSGPGSWAGGRAATSSLGSTGYVAAQRLDSGPGGSRRARARLRRGGTGTARRCGRWCRWARTCRSARTRPGRSALAAGAGRGGALVRRRRAGPASAGRADSRATTATITSDDHQDLAEAQAEHLLHRTAARARTAASGRAPRARPSSARRSICAGAGAQTQPAQQAAARDWPATSRASLPKRARIVALASPSPSIRPCAQGAVAGPDPAVEQLARRCP